MEATAANAVRSVSRTESLCNAEKSSPRAIHPPEGLPRTAIVSGYVSPKIGQKGR
jgi:hypothetical protein